MASCTDHKGKGGVFYAHTDSHTFVLNSKALKSGSAKEPSSKEDKYLFKFSIPPPSIFTVSKSWMALQTVPILPHVTDI